MRSPFDTVLVRRNALTRSYGGPRRMRLMSPVGSTVERGPRVLIIDADPVRALVTRDHLRGLGEPICVTITRCIEAALSRLDNSTQGFALIISRLELPEASGVEMIELAKHADPSPPVMLIAEEPDLDETIEAINRGGAGLVVGAHAWRELRQQTARLLGLPAP